MTDPGTIDDTEIGEDWHEPAARMVDALVTDGRLPSSHWQRILANFPRHLFAPDVDPAEAFTTAVVTQSRSGSDADSARPTSSLSAPAAVAVALEALAVAGGERVLEIGTGTGYVAGLLSRRLGDRHVYSMDIDPELVATAATRLKRLDLHPTLRAGDGYHGLAEHGPYDRILATCSITHVPPAWVRQLAPGGRIVAPLDGDPQSPNLVLEKTADDEVTGRFLADGGGFMPLRAALDSPFGPGEGDIVGSRPMPSYGTTALDPARIVERRPELALFLRLHLPGLRLHAGSPSAPRPTVMARQGESYATAGLVRDGDGRWAVTQSGPHRVWDTLETAVALWEVLGGPDPSRYGITALDDVHRQYVWLDDPEGPYSWPLLSAV